MNRRPLFPGAGFWVLFSTLVAFVGLFAWAASPSDFDVVRMAQARLEAGKSIPLSGRELDALEEVVSEYPGLATTLANGRPLVLFEELETGCLRFPRTHLLVLPSERPVEVVIGCQAASSMDVRVTGEGLGEVVRCELGATQATMELPASKEVRVVELEREGETAWSGESCALRVGGRQEVAP